MSDTSDTPSGLLSTIIAKYKDVIEKNERSQQTINMLVDLMRKNAEQYETTIKQMNGMLDDLNTRIIETTQLHEQNKHELTTTIEELTKKTDRTIKEFDEKIFDYCHYIDQLKYENKLNSSVIDLKDAIWDDTSNLIKRINACNDFCYRFIPNMIFIQAHLKIINSRDWFMQKLGLKSRDIPKITETNFQSVTNILGGLPTSETHYSWYFTDKTEEKAPYEYKAREIIINLNEVIPVNLPEKINDGDFSICSGMGIQTYNYYNCQKILLCLTPATYVKVFVPLLTKDQKDRISAYMKRVLAVFLRQKRHPNEPRWTNGYQSNKEADFLENADFKQKYELDTSINMIINALK